MRNLLRSWYRRYEHGMYRIMDELRGVLKMVERVARDYYFLERRGDHPLSDLMHMQFNIITWRLLLYKSYLLLCNISVSFTESIINDHKKLKVHRC